MSFDTEFEINRLDAFSSFDDAVGAVTSTKSARGAMTVGAKDRPPPDCNDNDKEGSGHFQTRFDNSQLQCHTFNLLSPFHISATEPFLGLFRWEALPSLEF